MTPSVAKGDSSPILSDDRTGEPFFTIPKACPVLPNGRMGKVSPKVTEGDYSPINLLFMAMISSGITFSSFRS